MENFWSALARKRLRDAVREAIHTRVALAGASGHSSLGQEIVSAASSDSSPNEFAHRRRLRKNNARIDIGRIGFGAPDVGLIDQ
jgi:hypothetical protein